MTSVTVLTGRERRRRWSAGEKARIVAESLESGASVTEVARRHDVHPNLLHLWRRRVRSASAGGGRLSFLPVAVAPQSRRLSPGDGAIEIELDGGVRLRVDGSIDETALGRVLRALRR
jgi:transposase